MDDVLSGADNISEALSAAQELIELLRRGGFPLQKWSTNSPELEAYLPSAIPATIERYCLPSELHSMLGLKWKPHKDRLIIQSSLESSKLTTSKRGVLSSIAKLFDPLGYAAPALIQAKIFLQSLWLTKLSWDDPLPNDLTKRWRHLYEELSSLYLELPRWLGCSSMAKDIEIFGFSDASERAMAAVLYIAFPTTRKREVHLLGAKTKLAPIKQISLPRLELNASLLLVRLAKKILSSLELESSIGIYLWSDSTTVLSWIKGHPSKWQTYIANRVSEIQTSLPKAKWLYIPSNQSPADCATRGLSSRQLKDHALWWVGPTWAAQDQGSWPDQPNITTITAPEQRGKPSRTAHHLVQSTFCDEFINRFSCFLRMLRTTAYCLRFLYKSKPKGPLSVEELLEAKLRLIKLIQQREFFKELRALNSHQTISRDSSLIKLNPILDKSGILRVGGRLKHSLLDPEEKHPIILPPNHHFTTLVIRDAHKRTFHGGVQLSLATLRRNWWILKGRQAVKSTIHRCVTCKRFQASALYQKMADLPKERIVPSRPFLHTGVDYAGPIRLRTTKGRGHKSYKSYIAVFVCFFSRAVHLEAVTDYTSESFLAAYRRFTSRRGLCATLRSDRGTNFIGAAAELKSLFEGESHQHLAENFANEGTIWRFNPPGAPHFGGLWEASVKSIKYHLKRVIGESILTYEEMSTLLCQIEGILNSRPLQPLSDDPDDPSALTPAHFLVGTSLLAVPDHPDNQPSPKSSLAHFRLVQSQKQGFWKKWSEEYIQQLQTRNKWHRPTNPIAEGDLVLIKNETTPPTRWQLARITEVHKGPDGLVRVATLKTASTKTTRPITKLVPILSA